MSKKIIYRKRDQAYYQCNHYVKSVSTKGITYTDEFKHHFYY